MNTLNIPRNTHLIFHCQKRGIVQKEMIKNLKDFANSLNLDPEFVVLMELQSCLNEMILINNRFKNPSEEDKNYIRTCELADLKYNKLPKDFYHRCLSSVPKDVSFTTLEDKWTDLPFLLNIWNRKIEDSMKMDGKCFISKVNLVKFQKLVRQRLKEGKSEIPRTEINLDEINQSIQPPRDVLQKLECDLGFRVLDNSDFVTLNCNGFGMKVQIGMDPVVGRKRANSQESQKTDHSKRNKSQD